MWGRSGQECPAGAKYARGPRGNPAKRFPWGEEAQRNERVFPPRKTSDMKLVPTMGGASIASGYTPDALAGARPRHPRPQGGERSSMQRKKTAIITARMTPGIKDLIQHQAKQAGMTVTDYIITCALGKEIVRVDGLDEILTEVKAQGRNLNQLTTLANMGRIQVLRSDELIDSYADLCQKLLRISREVQ